MNLINTSIALMIGGIVFMNYSPLQNLISKDHLTNLPEKGETNVIQNPTPVYPSHLPQNSDFDSRDSDLQKRRKQIRQTVTESTNQIPKDSTQLFGNLPTLEKMEVSFRSKSSEELKKTYTQLQITLENPYLIEAIQDFAASDQEKKRFAESMRMATVVHKILTDREIADFEKELTQLEEDFNLAKKGR